MKNKEYLMPLIRSANCSEVKLKRPIAIVKKDVENKLGRILFVLFL
jgi:hypothetical protein|tara:strand:+ start:665 stop:802 length:138 start_codon:yes stop_codon:yes gene_type:complete